MLTYSMFAAKQHFSEIIDEIRTQNKSCVISKSGKDVAVITPIKRNKTRKIGLSKGKFSIPSDFDAPLSDEVINSFYAGKL